MRNHVLFSDLCVYVAHACALKTGDGKLRKITVSIYITRLLHGLAPARPIIHPGFNLQESTGGASPPNTIYKFPPKNFIVLPCYSVLSIV